LFLAASSASWFGLVVVTQNIVGSLFNSHLSDFTHGWMYVFGVGVIAGMVSRETPTRMTLPAKPRILVIALRRLGDVLLTTPLIRSLRRAWPDATIDALVFADTAGILEGNPDLNAVIQLPTRPSARESSALAAQLWKRYALAVSTQSGDRPTLFAWIAGRRHVAPVGGGLQGALRRPFLSRTISPVDGVHRVEDVLRLADLIGIPRVPEVVCPRTELPSDAPEKPFAVIHAAPMFRYKRWTSEGWRAVAAALAGRGLEIVTTGGPGAAERAYLDEIWDGMAVERRDGRLTWPEIARYLAQAAVYVGPDTSVTHLAAASGCPTIALFGPTDPRLWGPWPAAGLSEPWAAAGTIQHRGNVWLVQNPLPCLPCQNEGCECHVESRSRCLDELAPAQVLLAVEQALGVQNLSPHDQASPAERQGSAPAQRPVRMI
jgi:heptosyltransferase-3